MVDAGDAVNSREKVAARNGTVMGMCVAWNSATAARGYLQCSPDGKMCGKLLVRKEHNMKDTAGIFMFKRVICNEHNECKVFKVGKCFDVGKPVFTNCNKAGRLTRQFGGKCYATLGSEYGAAELEKDTRTFADMVVKQLKEDKGWPKPCSNSTSTVLYKMYQTTDQDVALGSILAF